jgi:hypothetical protein
MNPSRKLFAKVSSNLVKDTELRSVLMALKKFEGIFTDLHTRVEQNSIAVLPQG